MKQRLVLVIKEMVRSFNGDRCMQHAAAISFYAVLSLIPLLILVFATMGYVITFLGPAHGSQEELVKIILLAVEEFVPYLAGDIQARLAEMVDAREAMGIIGFVVLLVTSSLVFGAIESALGEIFRSPRAGHFFLSKLFFTLFFIVSGLVLVTLSVGVSIVNSWLSAYNKDDVFQLLHSSPFIGFVAAMVITGSGFMVVVRYFSMKKIRFVPLLIGAVVFFVLWQVSRIGFGFYIEHIARFSLLYGSLATFMIGIIWIFYGALILLISAELVKVLDRHLGRAKEAI